MEDFLPLFVISIDCKCHGQITTWRGCDDIWVGIVGVRTTLRICDASFDRTAVFLYTPVIKKGKYDKIRVVLGG